MQKPKPTTKKNKKKNEERLRQPQNYCWQWGNIKPQDTSQVFHTSTTGHTTQQPKYEEKKERHA